MWTAGNEAFWDYLAGHSFGNFDLLKILDSRGRSQRFAKYGLMNEPGFKPAIAPDAFGLWLDVPDHAAVDLSVRLIQADRRGGHYAGLVNAVLRQVTQHGRHRRRTRLRSPPR